MREEEDTMFDATRRQLLAALACAAGGLAKPAFAAADDIVVGHIGPWTVLPVPHVMWLNQGMKAHFAQVNASGGIRGRKISLFDLDDAYTEEGFVKRFKEAMQRKPVALLSPIGSSALKRMLDDKLLDQNDVVILNAIPGSEAFRSPGHPRLFHLRAGDRQQIDKMVQHARTLGITRLTVIYEALPIGEDGLAMAKEAVARIGQMKMVSVGAKREKGVIPAAAKQIAASDTQCVLVLGSPPFAIESIGELRKAGVAQSVFTFSYVSASQLAKVAGDDAARGVGITQAFPNPTGVNTPLQREFRAAMTEAFPKIVPTSYTVYQLEGYVTARVLVEALRRTQQATPEQLAKALKTMGELDLGGYRINFSKSNVGSNFVDIGVVTTGGRLMY
jgi:branched-chain amino acid transport system substrate-binding protein